MKRLFGVWATVIATQASAASLGDFVGTWTCTKGIQKGMKLKVEKNPQDHLLFSYYQVDGTLTDTLLSDGHETAIKNTAQGVDVWDQSNRSTLTDDGLMLLSLNKRTVSKGEVRGGKDEAIWTIQTKFVLSSDQCTLEVRPFWISSETEDFPTKSRPYYDISTWVRQ